MSEAETIHQVEGGQGTILLNRPHVLNALSPSQLAGLGRLLLDWRDDPEVGVVVIEGAGERAFCAGGDIRAVWDNRLAGRHDANRAIFRDEYRLDRLIHHYPKPFVALLDGIVMGGGAGVSINGRWRVATERTLFAMPETAIGFFPDVGATHFLSRCPGRVGLYLGLTGTRLRAADCLWAGLATHFVPTTGLPALKAELAAAAASADPGGAVEAVLARHHRDPGEAPLARRAPAIDRLFSAPTLREVISALVAEGEEWTWDALEPIGDNSPTSLAVTFRQLSEGRELAFDDAIRHEYRLACRFLDGHDFAEGIRALVVDKDKAPRWEPPSLADIPDAELDRLFAPLDDGELEFFPD